MRHSLVIHNVIVFHIYLCPKTVTVSVITYSQIPCLRVLTWVFLKLSPIGSFFAVCYFLLLLFGLCSAKGPFLPFSVFGVFPLSCRARPARLILLGSMGSLPTLEEPHCPSAPPRPRPSLLDTVSGGAFPAFWISLLVWQIVSFCYFPFSLSCWRSATKLSFFFTCIYSYLIHHWWESRGRLLISDCPPLQTVSIQDTRYKISRVKKAFHLLEDY